DATGVWLMPLVSTLIAAFLLCFAIENIAARDIDRRWTTMYFGVASGIGFAVALRELEQFAGHHRLTSIIAFASGIQAGELLLFAAGTLVTLLLAKVLVGERLRTVVASACLADIAWHSMLARG